MFEQAELELRREHTPHGAIHERDIDRAVLHQPGELAVAIERRQLEVEPGCQRLRGRGGLVGCSVVMGDEERDGEVIGDDHTVEAQLIAQQRGQDGRGPRARQAVDRAVRVHHRRKTGVTNRGRERFGEHLAQFARPEVDGGVIHATFR